MDTSKYIEFFNTLANRDITSTYNGFAVVKAENGHQHISISFDSDKQIPQIRKFAQINQTPEFRFISLEPVSEIFFNNTPLHTPKRFQFRFRVVPVRSLNVPYIQGDDSYFCPF
nr:hypothetical protein [Bastrovirus sp.]